MSVVLSLCPLICPTIFALVTLIFGKWILSHLLVTLSTRAPCNLHSFEHMQKFQTKASYPSFDAYVKSVRAARKKTSIQGKLGPGNFNFVSEVNDALDIVTTGDYGTGVTYSITIPHDYKLTDGSGLVNYTQSSALYFCPTAATPGTGVKVTSSNGSAMDPAELAQVLHDLTSGYNFGFINSPVLDPVTQVPFGDEASSNWFAHSTKDTLYQNLQPDHPYYNQYSEVISVASHGSVYGFPYADAVHGVTLNTVVYPGTNPPSPVSGWRIVIGPPASL